MIAGDEGIYAQSATICHTFLSSLGDWCLRACFYEGPFIKGEEHGQNVSVKRQRAPVQFSFRRCQSFGIIRKSMIALVI